MNKWLVVERLALYTAVLGCAAFAGSMYFKLQESKKASDHNADALNAQIAQENLMKVGETLPSGLMVKDGNDRDVDLRSAIHGPTLVFKVAMDCQPCLDTLTWLRTSGATFKKVEQANILVLAVRSKAVPPGTFPPDVHLLYTKDDLSSTFLAGTLTPAEFMFDNTGKLVARQAGYSGDMATKLQFPSASL